MYIFIAVNSTKSSVDINDIVIFYFGNSSASFKLFAQVKNQKEGKIEITTLFEESRYNFLIQNEIKEVYIRIVFSHFFEVQTFSNAIENMNISPLRHMILDPLKIGESCEIMDDTISRREVSFPHLSEEQKSAVIQTHSMCLSKDQPNIKLIEGPPGSGKSLIIQNLVLELLHKNVLRKKPRILLCAKNNTAVDNTLRKIVEKDKTLNVVRYGVDKLIDPKVLNYSISSLVTRKWRTSGSLRENISRELNLSQLIQDIKSSPYKSPTVLSHLQALEEELKTVRKALEMPKEEKNRLTKYYINNADLVCTTLPSCSRLLK